MVGGVVAGGPVGEPWGVDGAVSTCTCSVGARTWSIGGGVVAGWPVGGPDGAAKARARAAGVIAVGRGATIVLIHCLSRYS